MDYSKMSDFEINMAIAKALQYPTMKKQHFGEAGLSVVMLEVGYGGHFDPCKNAADAWPIIVSNKIDIDWGDNHTPELIDHVSANTVTKSGKLIAFDVNTKENNPLRAAMLVYLQLREAK